MGDLTDTDRALLDTVIASYLRALDTGRPDRRGLLARYPELASELNSFFANQDLLFGGRARPSGPPDSRVLLRPAPARRASFQIGSVFAGRYRIVDVKAGGMGRVYVADDLEADPKRPISRVAIKTVPDFDEWHDKRERAQPPADTNPALYQHQLVRFRREAIQWVRLGAHANIILAMWVIDVGAKPYLIMEYADGGDLADWIRATYVRGGENALRTLTVPVALNFAIQFCSGMMHAVRVCGMVHRDIKPSNVLVTGGKTVKIADFGLAKTLHQKVLDSGVVGDGGSSRDVPQSYDMSAVGAGTVSYMAPEQFRSLALADTRSDIFSFGAMLFEMMTGKRLFAERHALELAAEEVPLPAAHVINAEVPRELSRIISRCLSYRPDARYQTFEDLDVDLRRANEQLPPESRAVLIDSVAPATWTPSVEIVREEFSLIALGQFHDAVNIAHRGIEIDPLAFQHWLNKGVALLHLKEFLAAKECFVRATELRPRDPGAWSNLASAMVTLGEAGQGLTAAIRATEIDESFADAWIVRGNCEDELGRAGDAVSSYERAAELAPHDWKLHANWAMSLIRLDKLSDAITILRRAVTINPREPQCWKALGVACLFSGLWSDARSAIDRSLEMNPADARVWALRCKVLLECGDSEAAATSLRKAIDLGRSDGEWRAVLTDFGLDAWVAAIVSSDGY